MESSKLRLALGSVAFRLVKPSSGPGVMIGAYAHLGK